MRILVTGAVGFVGRTLVPLLHNRGHQVWGMGRDGPGDAPQGIAEYHCGNLASDSDMDAFVQRASPDAVIHLAGVSSVAASWRDTSDTIDSSVVAAVNLCLSLGRTSAPVRVFVNVGSAEEYAASDRPLAESSPITPSSPYGIAKVAQARALRLLCANDGIGFVHFRPFNHVGPGQHAGFVLSDWAKQLAQPERGKERQMSVGNLNAVRDFTDVRDICRAYVAAAEGNVPEGTYNLASGVGRTLREVLQELISLAGVRVVVKENVRGLRPEDTPVRIGDFNKIRETIGWRPEIPWETTLKDTLSWWARAREEEGTV